MQELGRVECTLGRRVQLLFWNPSFHGNFGKLALSCIDADFEKKHPFFSLFFSIPRFDHEVKPIGRPKRVFPTRGGFLGVGRSQTDKSLSLSLYLSLHNVNLG